ncbi:carbohydrate ABC transporter permease [Thermus thermophilus]|uniref:carbohydrate ABC transporter permease n=1 Tax=Thermus thermophilus TaxID=274 RepID=UPI001CC4992E|nr:carbohydrate ABC transporter permease [Thermus thermophilus]
MLQTRAWPLLALGLLLLSSPLLAGYAWLALSSFAQEVHGLRPVGGLTLNNWRFLVEPLGERPPIGLVLFNTLLFAFGVAFLVVFVSAMAAYALSRLHFRGRGIYLGLVLVLHAFPAVSLLIAIFYVLRLMGLFDTLLGVILVQTSFLLPLGIWVLKGFFDNIPWDLERAALVDGASRWTFFLKIALPQVRPGLLALGTFAFIAAWGEFILPYTLIISNKTWTLALYLQSLLGAVDLADYGLVAAVGFFYLLPVLLLFLLGQRFLLTIYGGGVKG